MAELCLNCWNKLTDSEYSLKCFLFSKNLIFVRSAENGSRLSFASRNDTLWGNGCMRDSMAFRVNRRVYK